MTDKEIDQYFSYHNENMKLLKIGFDSVRDHLKELYKFKRDQDGYIFLLGKNNTKKTPYVKEVRAYSRILSGIQVSWAEEAIKRLLYEKNVLTDNQRQFLLNKPSLDQRWYNTLKIVFSIAYGLLPANDEICDTVKIERERRNLGNDLVDHYFNLRKIITDHLVPNITIRNKVQHGEWEYAFKPPNSEVYCQDLTDKINNENVVTTTSRYNLVNTLYQLIVDLGRFKSDQFALDSMLTPFEYFYKDRIEKINFEVHKIDNPKIENFITEMIERDKRGEQYRMR